MLSSSCSNLAWWQPAAISYLSRIGYLAINLWCVCARNQHLMRDCFPCTIKHGIGCVCRMILRYIVQDRRHVKDGIWALTPGWSSLAGWHPCNKRLLVECIEATERNKWKSSGKIIALAHLMSSHVPHCCDGTEGSEYARSSDIHVYTAHYTTLYSTCTHITRNISDGCTFSISYNGYTVSLEIFVGTTPYRINFHSCHLTQKYF